MHRGREFRNWRRAGPGGSPGLLEDYDFFAYSFEGDLAARGFGPDEPQLPGYYYQHDGQQLWEALGRYCADFVDEFYQTDDAVKADLDLQAWAAETSSPAKGNVPGFPTEIHSTTLLAKTLQAIIGIGTIHHNGVNFPQFDYMSYQPHRPSLTFASQAGYYQYNERVSAIKENALTISQLTAVLTTPSDHTLDKLEPGPYFRGDEQARNRFEKIYENLKDDLSSVKTAIDERNKKLKIPYEYLRPDKVACSIDI